MPKEYKKETFSQQEDEGISGQDFIYCVRVGGNYAMWEEKLNDAEIVLLLSRVLQNDTRLYYLVTAAAAITPCTAHSLFVARLPCW